MFMGMLVFLILREAKEMKNLLIKIYNSIISKENDSTYLGKEYDVQIESMLESLKERMTEFMLEITKKKDSRVL